MARPSSVAVIFLFCFATGARAGPWRPDSTASHSAGGHLAASESEAPGSAADYLKAFDQTIIFP